MLAKPNRLLTADDFRITLRRGRRFDGANTIVYIADTGAERPARFGFIITKKVGNAVKRNLVRRRLRALCHRELYAFAAGTDVVIRALPSSATASWAELGGEVERAFTTGRRR